ncbi:MAG: hypothetical protein DCC75_09185 [Proteobacteria bacterium]|nr:MAG: hypothetical protein DCC75_09185 [Pseudomonadota bacterium]
MAHRAGVSSIERVKDFAAKGRPDVLRWMHMHDRSDLTDSLKARDKLLLSTLNIFQVRGPLRSPPQHKPSLFSLLTTLLARRYLVVMFGAPFNPFPGDSCKDIPVRQDRLLRLIKVDFSRNLKMVRGTPLQSLEQQENAILSGPEFEREIKVISERTKQSLPSLKRRASKSFYDMAANPRRAAFIVASPLVGFILRRLFSEVKPSGLDQLAPAVKEHTVVFVPMHRSHLDYILVSWILYRGNLNPPLIAAGVNLSFWPFGYIIRNLGGYFIKRNARDRLHALILKRYVTYLVKRGHSQEFFIEGGRSRSGKMLPPKLGLLGIFCDAFTKGLRKDILFVPVSIAYENVIEGHVFGDENTGRGKRKESLLSLIKARKFLLKKYGDVVVNFGKPISLKGFVNGAGNSRENQNMLERGIVHEFGLELTRKIRDQVSPSLTSLALTALSMAPRYALTSGQLVRRVRELGAMTRDLGRYSQNMPAFTPALESFMEGRDFLVQDLLRGGIVVLERLATEDVYYIPGSRRFTADFYRNSVYHFFFPISILGVLDLLEASISSEEMRQLHQLLAHEHLLPKKEVFMQQLRDLATFLEKRGDLKTARSRVEFVSRSGPAFIPQLLWATIQGYQWVYSQLSGKYDARSENGAQPKSNPEQIDYEQFLSQAQSDFRTAIHLGLMHRSEAAARSSLVAVLDSLADRQEISIEENKGQRSSIVVKCDLKEPLFFLERISTAILRHQTGSLGGSNGGIYTSQVGSAAIDLFR